MARSRKPTADKDQFVPSKSLPEFIEIKPKDDMPEEVIEYLVKRAAYVGSFGQGHDSDRLDSLINARWILGAKSVREWKDLINTFYPLYPLSSGERPNSHTSDAKVKAHCLKHALTCLLELMGAPATIMADLEVLLSGYPVKELKPYSRAQRELLVDRTTSYRQIETKTGVDQSEITQAVKAGHLLDPWSEGRT